MSRITRGGPDSSPSAREGPESRTARALGTLTRTPPPARRTPRTRLPPMSRLCVLALLLVGAGAGCSSADRAAEKAAPAGATAKAAASDASGSATPDSASPERKALLAAADRGRILGAETAPIWLLVVSDFQCPWCKQWHDATFPAIRKQYVEAGRIRVAYLNFPIRSHANALPAAIAALAASAQGKFWPAHDRLRS